MRRMLRFRVLVAVLAPACVLLLVWFASGWPPPALLLAHGAPPGGGPTGLSRKVGGIEFVQLSEGYFRMGSHFNCRRGDLIGSLAGVLGLEFGQLPDHKLYDSSSLWRGPCRMECPTRWQPVASFWIARTEVTVAQYYRTIVGPPDRGPLYDNSPMSGVTHSDAVRFCMLLSEDSNLRVRLPSESEWEYACRAGTTFEFGMSPDRNELPRYAVFGYRVKSKGDRALPVASRTPNAWGLYDMQGNVWEWCQEERSLSLDRGWTLWSTSRFRLLGTPEDAGPYYAVRGGSMITDDESCRPACRAFASRAHAEIGFRPVIRE